MQTAQFVGGLVKIFRSFDGSRLLLNFFFAWRLNGMHTQKLTGRCLLRFKKEE